MSDIKPTDRQLEYQDWEFGVFLHFGIRTFYEGFKDWDGRKMEAAAFLPTDLDCEQWAATAEAAGAKYMVLTAKHHDGFANWPSKYTDFSVAGSSWRDGKGDVVRDFVSACRRHNLKVGLYYSPADASSSAFGAGDAKAYDNYFIGQISEILTGYGEIDILWFDGCHSENHEYDWIRICGEIRLMQPNVLIFNMGDPDFRWVGNEAGVAPIPTWNAVSALDFSVLADRKKELESDEPKWLPAECDCRMRYSNWFYSDQDELTVKSLEQLMGIYYLSVGRGCNLLINIGPDRRGLLPDIDSQRLIELGREVRRRFANPSATLETAIVGEDTVSWKFSDPGILTDHIVLQENLAEGEHIRRFRIEGHIPHVPFENPVTLWEGQNIGHKAICRFPLTPLNGLTIRILESSAKWSLRSIDLYNCSADGAV